MTDTQTALTSQQVEILLQLAEEAQKQKAPTLTERELAILRLMADGKRNKEIARALGIVESTVKVHRKSIHLKLGVKTGAHAVSIALRTGLVPLEVVG